MILKNVNLSLLLIGATFACRPSALPEESSLQSFSSGEVEYEVITATDIETVSFPFQKCRLDKGAVLKLKTNPIDNSGFSKITISSMDLSKVEVPISTGSVSISESASVMPSAVPTETRESMETPSSEKSLSDLLDEVASGGPTYKFSLTSAVACTPDSFAINAEMSVLTSSITKIERSSPVIEPSGLDSIADKVAPSSPGAYSNGYEFPLLTMPTNDWFYGAAAFGSYRSGGRLHGASDLYTPAGRTIVAIADGKVLDYYYFYSGTHALVVEHDDGRVVRYGEISSNIVPIGKRVKKGEAIARVGVMNCCNPMLHFEMYKGTATGYLTQTGANQYNRRRDIMNPQYFLDEHKRR